MLPKPIWWLFRPESKAARVGEQWHYVKPVVAQPPAANRRAREWGRVRQCRVAPKPTSSSRINTTLGAPFGAVGVFRPVRFRLRTIRIDDPRERLIELRQNLGRIGLARHSHKEGCPGGIPPGFGIPRMCHSLRSC